MSIVLRRVTLACTAQTHPLNLASVFLPRKGAHARAIFEIFASNINPFVEAMENYCAPRARIMISTVGCSWRNIQMFSRTKRLKLTRMIMFIGEILCLLSLFWRRLVCAKKLSSRRISMLSKNNQPAFS
jgi:hypothetical protein